LQSDSSRIEIHPNGDSPVQSEEGASEPIGVDTFGGRIHIQCDPEAAATPFGQLGFFVQFLDSRFISPVRAGLPAAVHQSQRSVQMDILGTYLLATLAAQKVAGFLAWRLRFWQRGDDSSLRTTTATLLIQVASNN
jgi:hypothetical protein